MAITLRRQISEEEKEIILGRHGRVCFATGHPISKEDTIHFDHIRAFINRGQSEIDNIAPMCENHNKQKGQLPLYDFKIKLMIEDFFDVVVIHGSDGGKTSSPVWAMTKKDTLKESYWK